MSDFRALCEELAQQLDDALDFTVSSATRKYMKALITRARAALAVPADCGYPGCVDDSPDDKCVRWLTGECSGPTARTLLAQPAPVAGDTTEKAIETGFRLWWKGRYGESYFGAVPLISVIEWTQHLLAHHGGTTPAPVGGPPPTRRQFMLLAEEMGWGEAHLADVTEYARAVLARFGGTTPAPVPVPIPSTLITEIEAIGNDPDDHKDYEGYEDGWKDACFAVASLLHEQGVVSPCPVPVSERLPGAEDCDAEGRCWWFTWYEEDDVPQVHKPGYQWVFSSRSWRDTHWLPASALPLPEVAP